MAVGGDDRRGDGVGPADGDAQRGRPHPVRPDRGRCDRAVRRARRSRGRSSCWTASGTRSAPAVTQLANNDPTNPPSTVDFAITEMPAAITASDGVHAHRHHRLRPDGRRLHVVGRRRRHRHRRRQRHPRSDRGDDLHGGSGWPGSCGSRTTSTGCAASRSSRTAPRSPSAGRPARATPAAPSCCSTLSSAPPTSATTCCSNPTTSATATTSAPSPSTPPPARSAGTRPSSLGQFTLPVDAAALHSSGRVVAVHTDSGRLAHVLPATTPQPPLAAYSAGPGTEIGLLSSPTAVAVTNPGIVIVLEAGASQLAAFDLNGNPVRYFGTATPADFTLGLLPVVHLPRRRRRRRQPDLPALLRRRRQPSRRLPHRRLQPHRHPRSPPTAPAPTSPTSPSTTGAASSPPTTPPSSTPPPTNPTSTPPSASPNPPSAASTRREQRGCPTCHRRPRDGRGGDCRRPGARDIGSGDRLHHR